MLGQRLHGSFSLFEESSPKKVASCKNCSSFIGLCTATKGSCKCAPKVAREFSNPQRSFTVLDDPQRPSAIAKALRGTEPLRSSTILSDRLRSSSILSDPWRSSTIFNEHMETKLNLRLCLLATRICDHV